MTEIGVSSPEQKIKPVQEFLLPGCRFPLIEITTNPEDVDAVTEIDKALSPEQYAETDANTDSEKMLSWLKTGATRKFDNIHVSSPKRKALGTGEEKPTAAEEIIIATKPFNERGKISGYTYVYRSGDYKELPPDLQEKYAAETAVDMSYVTKEPDEKRNIEEMAESLMQTAWLFWRKSLNEGPNSLKEDFTPEQRKEAQKRLAIFANAGAGDDEINYRKALIMAGFEEVHRTQEEEGEEGSKVTKTYISHRLSLEKLSEVLEQKRQNLNSPKI